MGGDASSVAASTISRFIIRHFDHTCGNDSDDNLITACHECHSAFHNLIKARN